MTFGVLADVFDRPDAATVLSALAAGVTDAIAGVLGASVRDAVTVEFVPQAPARIAVGGRLGA